MVKNRKLSLSIVLLIAAGSFLAVSSIAQNPDLQQKIAEIKDAAALNKQMLAQYTWQEQVTISLKGEQKKQELFQVRQGPDGKPQKSQIDTGGNQSSGGREGRLKKRVVEKKTEEYKDYADSIKTLIEQYLPPDKNLLEQARQQGNISIAPQADPGVYSLAIANYVKPGDKMTLVLNKAAKQLISVSISTYLSDPTDAVTVSAQFARIPGGPNHVSSETINGKSKQLTIVIQNSGYQTL